MSHRKVNSQCTVPFQWEEIPGVPKSNFVHHSFSKLPPPDLAPSDYDHYQCDFCPKTSAHEMNIPLPPPCPVQSMHKRSSSFRARGLVKQEDPFVAALKECTKGGRSEKAAAGSKNVGGGTTDLVLKSRKSKFGNLFCMRSDDVALHNLVRLAKLPPLSRGRSSYRGFVKKTME